MVLLLGEISTTAKMDYPAIVRNTIKEIGFDEGERAFDYNTCNVIVAIEQQSPEISEAVNKTPENLENMGAGDQVGILAMQLTPREWSLATQPTRRQRVFQPHCCSLTL